MLKCDAKQNKTEQEQEQKQKQLRLDLWVHQLINQRETVA